MLILKCIALPAMLCIAGLLGGFLLSGNINPLDWRGAPFESTIFSALGLTGGVVTLIVLVGCLIVTRRKKATKKSPGVKYDPRCVVDNWPDDYAGLR